MTDSSKTNFVFSVTIIARRNSANFWLTDHLTEWTADHFFIECLSSYAILDKQTVKHWLRLKLFPIERQYSLSLHNDDVWIKWDKLFITKLLSRKLNNYSEIKAFVESRVHWSLHCSLISNQFESNEYFMHKKNRLFRENSSSYLVSHFHVKSSAFPILCNLPTQCLPSYPVIAHPASKITVQPS